MFKLCLYAAFFSCLNWSSRAGVEVSRKCWAIQLVFIGKRVSSPKRAGSFLPRFRLPVKSLVEFVFVYMGGGQAFLSEIWLFTTQDFA